MTNNFCGGLILLLIASLAPMMSTEIGLSGLARKVVSGS